MLEFLANVDPMALPIWAILLLSASMFPVGILLPCSRCCVPPCGTCEEGELPETLTVTLDGFPSKYTYGQGSDLITVTISAPFGGGASARVTGPGDVPGPITGVSMVPSLFGGASGGGSGYAKLGRVQPTVTASGGSGTGATFSVSLSQHEDDSGVDYWKVSSVSVTGGTDYKDGDKLKFSIASGDTAELAALATIRTTREEPTLSASGSGTGAVLDITLGSASGTPQTWGIASIAVSDGGSGYVDGETVVISLGTDDVSVTKAVAKITADSGVIQSVAVTNGGSYFKDTGVPASVSVDKAQFSPESTRGGVYYREDSTASPYVAEVTIDLYQLPPSAGTGAVLSAVIDDDPQSATFGQITSITIGSGGDEYVAWESLWHDYCCDWLNGKAFVVRRYGDGCTYRRTFCGPFRAFGTPYAQIEVVYPGASQPPIVAVNTAGQNSAQENISDQGCSAVLTSTTVEPDCSDIAFTATQNFYGNTVTATVVSGGEWDNTHVPEVPLPTCSRCCPDDSTPSEVTVTLDSTHTSPGGGFFWDSLNGDYVLSIADNNAEQTIWLWDGAFGASSGSNGTAYRVLASVGICSKMDGNGFIHWQPRIPDGSQNGMPVGPPCNECFKKCSSAAWAYLPDLWLGLPSPRDCTTCDDAPLCSPAAGVYEQQPNWMVIPGTVTVV